MAIVDYASLLAALQDYALRTDAAFINRIPDFVGFVEEDINNEVKHRRMEVRATTFTAPGIPYISMPSDYLESINFVLVDLDGSRYALQYLSPTAQENQYPCPANARSTTFTIVGLEARLMPIPDQPYTIEMFYYGMVPNLVTNYTNWLIQYHPRVYLYGILREYSMWSTDDAGIQKYTALYEDAKQKMQEGSNNELWTAGVISPRTDVRGW